MMQRAVHNHSAGHGSSRGASSEPSSREGGAGQARSYNFNMCSGEDCSQAMFFDTCGVKQLLDSALNGYASTVFAYGQTGSGKTYSMSGMEERIEQEDYAGDQSEGLIPRSMRYVFEEIAAAGDDGAVRYTVRASFCEIYNEQVYDLLNMSQKTLQVRWNIRNGFFVQDLFV